MYFCDWYSDADSGALGNGMRMGTAVMRGCNVGSPHSIRASNSSRLPNSPPASGQASAAIASYSRKVRARLEVFSAEPWIRRA